MQPWSFKQCPLHPRSQSQTNSLKGLFTIFLFSVRSNILNINELRSHMAPWVEVPGDKIKTKKIEFGAFIGPSGQNQLYHTPSLLKIWDLTKNKKLWTIPLSWTGMLPHLNYYVLWKRSGVAEIEKMWSLSIWKGWSLAGASTCIIFHQNSSTGDVTIRSPMKILWSQ